MAEILFTFDVCMCMCVCLCAADRSIRSVWALNANSSKTVKATDLVEKHVLRDSPDMTP